MTMARAVVLLVLSTLVFGGGILALIVENGEGFQFTTTSGGSAGARTGPNAATPQGGAISPGQVEATVRAAEATATAIIASLTPGAGVPTQIGTDAPPGGLTVIGTSVAHKSSHYTVLQMQDPEPPGFFPAKDDNRRVAFEVRQEAGAQAAAFSFALFWLRGDDGTDYPWAITNGDPGFGSGSLNPGESNTGWITFNLPIGVAPAQLVLQDGVDRVPLVELR